MSTKSTIAEHRTSILIAIIALTGAVTPILVTSLSGWLSNMPVVDIDMNVYINSNNNKTEAQVTLTNIGFGPATDVEFFVDAPGGFSGSVNEFSTAHVRNFTILGTRSKAVVPELVQGGGSFVKVDLRLSQNRSVSTAGYTAYATYTQGSTTRWIYWDVDNPLTGYRNYFNSVFEPYFIILLISLTLFSIAFALYLYLFWKRNLRLRFFISGIINNITEIRRKLKKDSKSRESFRHIWDAHNSGVQLIKKKEMQDFIMLDDFYAELDERKQGLTGNISDSELEALNAHLLYLANNALEKIDWSKYPR